MSLKLKTFIRRNYTTDTDTVLHLATYVGLHNPLPALPRVLLPGCLILLNSPSLSGSKIQLSLSGANDFVKGSRLRVDRRWAGGLSPLVPPQIDPSVQQRVFTITEKAPTRRAFSWLKVATSAFTFKTLLRLYAKRIDPMVSRHEIWSLTQLS